MAAYHKIDELTTETEDWTLLVRVCRKWICPGTHQVSSKMDVLLMDIEGKKIHGEVYGELVQYFHERMEEGHVYYMRKFKVLPSPKINPVLTTPVTISFLDDTYVAHSLDISFPKSPYNFVSFPDIKGDVYHENGPLLDIIGHVVELDDSMMEGDGDGGDEYIRFVIQDIDYNLMTFLMFGPYSNEVKGYVDMHRENRLNQPVIIVQLCQGMMFNDEYVLCNTHMYTRMLLYNDSDEAVKYRKMLSYGYVMECDEVDVY